jgi:CTP synthase
LFLSCAGSDGTNPSRQQHSVKDCRDGEIKPDIIVLRCDQPLEEDIFRKISMFCNVKPDCVIENMTIPILYEAPLMLERSNFSNVVCRELHIDAPAPNMKDWREMVERINGRTKEVSIAIVGKYVRLHDAYLSVAEALTTRAMKMRHM